MATSGSYDWVVDRNDIVSAALRIIGHLDPNETATSEDVNTCSEALNMLLKSWNNRILGFQLFAQKRATVFLELNKSSYALGSAGDHATASYVETVLAATANTGARQVVVSTSTGIAVGDNIGIVLGDGNVQWTSVSATVSPSGTTQLAASLSATSTASSPVYAYTNKIEKPLEIVALWLRDSNNVDYSLSEMTRASYARIYDKTRDGRPYRWYYHPFEDAAESDHLTRGTLYFDYEPNDVTDSVEIIYRRPFQDFDAGADNPDVPPEAYKALKWNLAAEIAPEYGVPIAVQDRLNERAAAMLIEMRSTFGDMPRRSVPYRM